MFSRKAKFISLVMTFVLLFSFIDFHVEIEDGKIEIGFPTVFASPGLTPWYNKDYTYRKQMTVNGTSAGEQTNYQMKLTVHKGSGSDSGSDVYLNNHCQDDFDDIRFTKSDGITELDHTLTKYVSGDYAVFEIEFDSIPASPSSANFYIYYDNASASTGSDAATTYPDFQDEWDKCRVYKKNYQSTLGSYGCWGNLGIWEESLVKVWISKIVGSGTDYDLNYNHYNSSTHSIGSSTKYWDDSEFLDEPCFFQLTESSTQYDYIFFDHGDETSILKYAKRTSGTPPGEWGSWVTVDSGSSFDKYCPAVEKVGSDFWVVYNYDSGSTSSVKLYKWNSSTESWGSVTTLFTETCTFLKKPHLEYDGSTYRIYYAIDDRYLKVRTSDDGTTWSDPTTITSLGGTSESFYATVVRTGNYHYLFYYVGKSLLMAFSSDGVNFSKHQIVHISDCHPCPYSEILTDSKVLIGWIDSTNAYVYEGEIVNGGSHTPLDGWEFSNNDLRYNYIGSNTEQLIRKNACLSLGFHTTGSSAFNVHKAFTNAQTGKFRFQHRVRLDSITGGTAIMLAKSGTYTDSANWCVEIVFSTVGNIYGYNGATWTDTGHDYVANTDYDVKFIVDVGTDKFDCYLGETKIIDQWSFRNSATSLTGLVIYENQNYVRQMWMDIPRISKYVSPEPTWGSWGSEEGHVLGVSTPTTTFAYGQYAVNTTTSNKDCNATNTGNVTEDIKIKFSQFTDGTYNWTISTSAGANTCVIEWSIDGSSWTKMTAWDTYVTVKSSLAVDAVQRVYIKITTPTSVQSGSEYSSTMTILAVES